MVEKGYLENLDKVVAHTKKLSSLWGQYRCSQDWMHEKIQSSAARISDVSKVPQELYEITSDVDTDCVSYFDWMAGGNDIKGYMVRVVKGDWAALDMVLDLRFVMQDFKVYFPKVNGHYGFSDIFLDGAKAKELIDAFWSGQTEKEIKNKLDILLNGRLDEKV